MAAEILMELYRTQEDRANYTFKAAVTISYFNRIAFIQGLSGTFTITCWRELVKYLFNEKHVTEIQYLRKGKLKTIRA